MADNNHDLANSAILNLTADEKRAFGFLFNQADSDQLGVVTGERAVAFFERTHVSPNVLGEIWQIADTENRGLLTKPGFCMVLRLIGHYQAGRAPTQELAFKPSPIPRFDGLQISGVPKAGPTVSSPTVGGPASPALQPQLSGQGPIRVPPLDLQKVQQYSGLFERSGAQNGMLDGVTAKSIFERAGLPNEVLGKIWNLSDREQRGALDQTEFIVAMHLLTSMKTRTMLALPNMLPSGLYEAAARRGIPPPTGSRQPVPSGVIPRQFTGSSAGVPPRTQSPLARVAPPVSAQTTGQPWLVTPAEKIKYDQYFATIDTQGLGVLNGEQAVQFFSDSRLPEETLATIWDLADINSAGQLTRDEFAVAMYMIRQQRMPNPAPLPAFLPPALMPPSMRQQQQQTASTAPAFDNANNTSSLPKSAADDLFGLDETPMPQAAVLPQLSGVQPQTTGASTLDPFGGSTPGSPTSPQRFQTQPPSGSSVFKPFMPTSAFGASLAQQHTGGSATSSQGQARGFQPQSQQPSHLQQSSAADDLLGDDDTHAAETSKITNETTELANMSNQIGNLRSQMEQTQAKKATTQQDLTATNTQKRDLELRLQQFRSQYEQEVGTVKELEQQLATSRESTKKLGQEMAMLEGTYQDLQTQHTAIAQALQVDQQENVSLKQKISQVNAAVSKLKPEIEKMKLDARQQKGLVSINKKQLTTNEGERDRLQGEKSDLERDAAEREEQARSVPVESRNNFGGEMAVAAGAAGAAGVSTAAFGAYEASKDAVASTGTTSHVASPSAASTMSSTNPFFRKASSIDPTDRAISPPMGPNPSAFDAIFGPSDAFSPSGQASNGTTTPPATSFIGRTLPPTTTGMSESVQSLSSLGESTPAATPPASETVKDSPFPAQTAPPLAQSQFTPGSLPLGGLRQAEPSETSSTAVIPPASRAGGVETPRELAQNPMASSETYAPGSYNEAQAKVEENVPGAFPSEHDSMYQSTPGPSTAPRHDDFDSAFANFGEGQQSTNAGSHAEDPFAVPSGTSKQTIGGIHNGEFPPIQSLEPDESDEESDDESTLETSAPGMNPPSVAAPAKSTQSNASELPPITAQTSPPSYEESKSPVHGGTGERSDSNHFPPEFGGLLPARGDPSTSPPPASVPSVFAAPVDEKERGLQEPQTSQSASQPPFAAPTSAVSETFHDAISRPISGVADTGASASTIQAPPPAQASTGFDDFDEFDDLSEAKEADKSASGLDFGFGSQHQDEFSPTFDSPAASTTNTLASAHQTPVAMTSRSLNASSSDANGFANFQPGASTGSVFGGEPGTAIAQQSPQNAQHDWDAIFSGLDSSKNVDTSFPDASDPWNTSTTATTSATTDGAGIADKATSSASTLAPVRSSSKPVPTMGRAITPGTEHDDPILKRLTGMGYPRTEALNALEAYDYDINRAVDHLTK